MYVYMHASKRSFFYTFRVMRQKLEKEKKKSVPFTFEGRYEFGKEEFLGLDERIWRDGIINRKDRNFYTGFYSLFFAREKSLGYLRYLFERVFSLFRALRISHLSFSFWTVYFGNGGFKSRFKNSIV